MAKNKESVIGTSAFDDWNKISNVPLTKSESCIYAHLLKGVPDNIIINYDRKPTQIRLLSNENKLQFETRKKEIIIHVDDRQRTSADDVVKISFD